MYKKGDFCGSYRLIYMHQSLIEKQSTQIKHFINWEAIYLDKALYVLQQKVWSLQ